MSNSYLIGYILSPLVAILSILFSVFTALSIKFEDEKKVISISIFAIICNIVGAVAVIVSFFNYLLEKDLNVLLFNQEPTFAPQFEFVNRFLIATVCICTGLIPLKELGNISRELRITYAIFMTTIGILIAFFGPSFFYRSIVPITFYIALNIMGQLFAGLAIAVKPSIRTVIESSSTIIDFINSLRAIFGSFAGILPLTLATFIFF
jgi:hypothetical protein